MKKKAIPSHWIFIVLYSVDVDLIPRADIDECPGNSQYKENSFKELQHYKNFHGSCNCEDHCGLDLCRLEVPPSDCLMGTYSEWNWDYMKNAWVAQVTQGSNFLSYNFFNFFYYICPYYIMLLSMYSNCLSL